MMRITASAMGDADKGKITPSFHMRRPLVSVVGGHGAILLSTRKCCSYPMTNMSSMRHKRKGTRSLNGLTNRSTCLEREGSRLT